MTWRIYIDKFIDIKLKSNGSFDSFKNPVGPKGNVLLFTIGTLLDSSKNPLGPKGNVLFTMLLAMSTVFKIRCFFKILHSTVENFAF